MRLGLSFDDVLLIPQKSEIKSRQDVSLRTNITKNIEIDIPLIAANMDTVCEYEMALAMGGLGGCGVVHRFMPIQEQAKIISHLSEEIYPVAAAIGVDKDAMIRATALILAGCNILVVDIAHGHSTHAIDMIREIKYKYPDVEVIAGNVVTYDGAYDLYQAGADAIKVGVGPGGVCTTRLVAGVGVPQITAIIECVSAMSACGIPVIADGGIKTSGDIAKALAAGASSVMIGSLFAGTKESPGEVFTGPNGMFKNYRGMASFEAIRNRSERNGDEINEEYFEQRAPEGVTLQIPYKGPVASVVNKLNAGVRSAMSYLNADSIKELQNNAEFIQITNAGVVESSPHALLTHA